METSDYVKILVLIIGLTKGKKMGRYLFRKEKNLLNFSVIAFKMLELKYESNFEV